MDMLSERVTGRIARHRRVAALGEILDDAPARGGSDGACGAVCEPLSNA
mgnify:CR=1 FL=1